nr:UDP-3-O-(3-hydroxymyristoyl)glucosamine N-acyltransferase [Alphaproteobacteria bacterium]
MADQRFFNRVGPFSLGKLAALSDGELNDPDQEDFVVKDIAALESAEADDLSFLDNKAYLDAFKGSKAGAAVVMARYAAKAPQGMALILSEQPYRTFALIAQEFYPRPRPVAG